MMISKMYSAHGHRYPRGYFRSIIRFAAATDETLNLKDLSSFLHDDIIILYMIKSFAKLEPSLTEAPFV
jgi:hypothetical protein